VIQKKISKILVPLDGSKNSVRGLETAITLARSCDATITGIHSIYAPPHSEFRGVGSVEEAYNINMKKFIDEAKTLAAKNGIVFTDKIVQGEIGYNIIKMAHGKSKFDMIVIGQEERVLQKKCSLEVYQTMSYIHQKFQLLL